MSYLKSSSIFCSVCFVTLGIFQLGALYGSSAYRELVNSNGTRQEFTQLTMDQSHTLYIVAIFSCGFALLNLMTMVIRGILEKKVPKKIQRGRWLARLATDDGQN